MSAWVEHAVDGSEFTLANLPWGVCRKPAHSAGTICVKVGDFVLDLRGWARSLHDMDPDKLDADTLNALEQVLQVSTLPYMWLLSGVDM